MFLGPDNRTLSSSETLINTFFYGAIGGPMLMALLLQWLFKSSSSAPLRETQDEQGLPVIEWQDELRAGGHMNPVVKVQRRCRIAFDKDGAPVFVHEFVEDASAKHIPMAAVLGGHVGVSMAKSFMKSRGIGVTENSGGAPWTALQAFVLTNDFEYFGQRTMSGDRPKENDAVIVADFGAEWGQMVVSRARVAPNVAADLHRSLSVAFIERRSGHLNRIATQNRQQRSEAAGPREKRI